MKNSHSKFLFFCTVAAIALTAVLTCNIKTNVDKYERDRLIDSIKDAQSDSLRDAFTNHSQIRDTN